MPATSKKQADYFRFLAHNPEARKEKGISEKVAKEFETTDEKTSSISKAGFYVEEQLSPNISITPEGYVLAENVNIARLGTLKYVEGELNVDADEDGYIFVHRTAEEVFKPEAIASFEGKPVTWEHPDDLVDVSNWSEIAKGTVQNVRAVGDKLVADLLITSEDLKTQILENGLREVSCGYLSEYEQSKPGYARQINIVGNHVALVEKGRAGPQCAIKDTAKNLITLEQERKMAKSQSLKGRILGFWKTMDAEAEKIADEIAEEVEKDISKDADQTGADISNDTDKAEETDDNEAESDIKAVLNEILSRLSKLEGAERAEDAEPEDKEETEDADQTGADISNDDDPVDEQEKTEDGDDNEEETEDEDEGEYPTTDTYKNVLARAEVMLPGVKLKQPTGDSASAKYVDGLNAAKVQVLKSVQKTEDGDALIRSIVGNKKVATLTKDAIDIVFQNVYVAKREQNNQAFRSFSFMADSASGTEKSIAEKIADISNFYKN